MKADAALRMNVYQEGQRAFNAGSKCPYTDWRAKTWEKGRAAAQAHYEKVIMDIRASKEEAPQIEEPTLRDLFATFAPPMAEQYHIDMQAASADIVYREDAIASWSYAYADAMLKARNL